MPRTFFCFGEMLWDLLPGGRHAGGAPFNVAAHLGQLGARAAVISAVGRDALGDEILTTAAGKAIDTRFVTRADGVATGTVKVTLDSAGNATYEIVRPVAWDEIAVTPAAVEAVARADGLVFGSLAARSPHNREQLDRLLSTPGPTKLFDVNLRPPFDDLPTVLTLAGRADVVKLNHEELAKIAAVLQGAHALPVASTDLADIEAACRVMADDTGARYVCVTMGAAGAALWRDGVFLHRPAPKIEVRDTVGAGDAFMAALALGLIRGAEPAALLDAATRLGAFVASQPGATPRLPEVMIADLNPAAGLPGGA